ncbi:heterokaryon incompatibility protein-domain-containing protein [Xylogone sp. PMI_703]|nr:heterokaryon incompatibility protein-domain-containing protein [Xylogone sp. PMI_703]
MGKNSNDRNESGEINEECDEETGEPNTAILKQLQTAEMPTFKYERISLETPVFRLLRLVKGDSDTIHCELFESKLPSQNNVAEYVALSYTWGSELRPCEIVMNGSRMEVTKNAYLALRDLRCQEEDRILWVDALCIDQSNIIERGEQVQQMRSIYSKAKQVIIWLGEATYDTHYVMHHMKQLEKEIIKDASNSSKVSDKRLDEIWTMMTLKSIFWPKAYGHSLIEIGIKEFGLSKKLAAHKQPKSMRRQICFGGYLCAHAILTENRLKSLL